MVIHNSRSTQQAAHARSGAARAGATAASPSASLEARAANPLSDVSRALGTKLDNLAQVRLLPSNEMPEIQDKHASLFVIPPDPDATPLMKNIAKYVNTILAAKEHVSTMPPDLPAKASLATLLDQHEELFVQLNDVATLLRFSGDAREDVEREVGSELLGDATKQAIKAFVTETITGTVRSEFSALNTIKQDRESQFTTDITDISVPVKERWPKNILPFGMTMRLDSLGLEKHIPVEKELPNLLYDLTLVGLVDQRRATIAAQTMSREDLEQIDSTFEQVGLPRLSETEKKKGLSRGSIEHCILLEAHNASVRLESAAGIELRKLSYEVARHAPEMVMKEMSGHDGIERHLTEDGNKGDPIKQLELLLDPNSADYEEKKNILADFHKKIDGFKIDKGLSIAENFVNSYFEAYSEVKMTEEMSRFIDGDTGANDQAAKGKTIRLQKEKRANQKVKKKDGLVVLVSPIRSPLQSLRKPQKIKSSIIFLLI